MPAPMPITLAHPSDAPAVSALVDHAYRQWLPILGRKPAPMLMDYPALIAAGRVFILREGAELVAVLVLWPLPAEAELPAALYLDNVAVHPAYRQRGLGEALLHFAEQQAQQQGLTLVRLLTNVKMVSNQQFYRKRGYTETRRETTADGRQVVWLHKFLS